MDCSVVLNCFCLSKLWMECNSNDNYSSFLMKNLTAWEMNMKNRIHVIYIQKSNVTVSFLYKRWWFPLKPCSHCTHLSSEGIILLLLICYLEPAFSCYVHMFVSFWKSLSLLVLPNSGLSLQCEHLVNWKYMQNSSCNLIPPDSLIYSWLI